MIKRNESCPAVMAPRVVSLAFHVARDPEFQEGIADGRALFPAEWDLTNTYGWWNVEDIAQFVQAELSQEKQAQENAVRALLERDLRTPIYHLGIVAGYLSRFSEAALAAAASRQRAESPEKRAACSSHSTAVETAALAPLVPEGDASHARALTFTIRDPRFREGMRLGAETYRQDHGSTSTLHDRDLLAFYHIYLTPFTERDALTNTGLLFGWLQALRQDSPIIVFEQGEFATGYLAGVQGWPDWQKSDLLTDADFTDFLVTELSDSLQAAMSEVEPYYTRTFQIGFAFGVVHALLADPTITLVQAESAQEVHA